ncbi:threonine dehydratase [Nocardioides sp. MAHUQ-72]|uniref:threonine dehydratase n=1 Tax=unclassified Nocardioides TaxID=2615069 RepID=UPI0036151011
MTDTGADDAAADSGAGPGDGTAGRRRQQEELYGAPVQELLDRIGEHVGLDLREVAGTIGVSVPMLTAVSEARRTRIGNPVATTRLSMLRDLADHLASGAADPGDIPVSVAQIAVATGPLPASGATVVAPSSRSGWSDTGSTITRESLRAATARVRDHVPVTATLRWPLLERFTGTPTYVKHENHNPTGAFKVRGGLNFVDRLLAAGDPPAGLVSASRGNHSQSLAFAGRVHDVPVTIVVPEGNSADKNQATEAYGAEVVEHGRDFQEAVEHAELLAAERGLLMVPSFHPWLVEGVATYAVELHEAVPDLDVVYVPVGMGSGICAHITVRDLLGRGCEVVGVVAERAPAYALSFAAGQPVPTETADTFVDGVACRTPHPDAVATISTGAARFVRVSEEQAAEAMALMYRCTHNLAEPAGALALAGLLTERERVAGAKVAVVHTGGNADFEVLQRAFLG